MLPRISNVTINEHGTCVDLVSLDRFGYENYDGHVMEYWNACGGRKVWVATQGGNVNLCPNVFSR